MNLLVLRLRFYRCSSHTIGHFGRCCIVSALSCAAAASIGASTAQPEDCNDGAVGLGIVLEKRGEAWIIKEVIAGSIAAQKQVKADQELDAVEEKKVARLSACEIAKLVDAPGHTPYFTVEVSKREGNTYSSSKIAFERTTRTAAPASSAQPAPERRITVKRFTYECPKCGLVLKKEGVGWYKCPIDQTLMNPAF